MRQERVEPGRIGDRDGAGHHENDHHHEECRQAQLHGAADAHTEQAEPVGEDHQPETDERNQPLVGSERRDDVAAAEDGDDGGAEGHPEQEPVPGRASRRLAERQPHERRDASRVRKPRRERGERARQRDREQEYGGDTEDGARSGGVGRESGKDQDAGAENRRDVQRGCRGQPDPAVSREGCVGIGRRRRSRGWFAGRGHGSIVAVAGKGRNTDSCHRPGPCCQATVAPRHPGQRAER